MATSSGELFLDSSYAIALSAPRDEHHGAALTLAQQLTADDARLVTTQAILVEIGNALARQRYRADAVRLLQSIRHDPRIEIMPLTGTLLETAFGLFDARTDKEWGMTDCISFTVMRERRLTDALTSDDHFRQAGFRALLLK
jgi:predicted nucleic acid-binding protein